MAKIYKQSNFRSIINIYQYRAQQPSKDVTDNNTDWLYGETFYSRHTAHTHTHCDIEIDERGTSKATKHDKYENIADSIWLSLFMGSKENAYKLIVEFVWDDERLNQLTVTNIKFCFSFIYDFVSDNSLTFCYGRLCRH
jgi:hypothetical protein